MKAIKITKVCEYCGKEYEAKPHQPNQKFCSRPCSSMASRGKGTRGHYSEYQVSQMAKAKREASKNRVKHLWPLFDRDTIKEVFELDYVRDARVLTKILGFNNKDFQYVKALRYLIEELGYKWSTKHTPVCYHYMSPSDLRYFISKVNECSTIAQLDYEIAKDEKSFGTATVAKNLKWLSENFDGVKLLQPMPLANKDTVCEKLMQNMLKDLNLNYTTQRVILTGENYFCKNEKVPRHKYCKPDLIVEDKLIIEVNGDYWHKFKPEVSIVNGTNLINEDNPRDVYKKQFYEQEGYRYLFIWEHDLRRKMPYAIIKSIIKEIMQGADNFKRIDYI